MSTTSATRVGLRGDRGPVLLAVMLSIGLAAIDSTILATALPSIVRDLGGLNDSAWLFSGYLLAQAVTVPIYGKLADMFGRKRIMLFGILLFVVASLLCGLAWSTTALIFFRVLQGLGAGAVQPIGMTIVGDIYTLAERARVQGYIASVWAIASIVGPTLGGVFSDFLTWRWIFFVNLPVGAAAIWMLARRYHEAPRDPRKHRIDVAGSLALALGSGLLLAALLEGGGEWGWRSPLTLIVLGASVVAFVVFVLVERRASEPVLPLWVFRHRVLLPSMVVALIVGMVMMAVTVYLPMFVQNVLGMSAIMGGIPLAAMTLGWPLGASQVGRFYLRFGFRPTMTSGALLALCGVASLLLLGPDTSIGLLTISCFVIGLGFGFCAPAGLVAAQTAVTYSNRGVATASNQFFRSAGSAVGTAVYGALFAGVVVAQLGRASNTDELDPDVIMSGLHLVFTAALVGAALLVFAAVTMPRRVEPAD